jgi:peptidyl-prolyl cis-trans isomerase SurA
MRHFRPLALLWVVAVAAWAPLPATAQTVQSIVAVVNDDIVTSQELKERLRLAVAAGGIPNDPEILDRLSGQVLRSVIDEKLQRQEAARLGITVTPAEVDRAMQQIAESNRMSRADLDAFLTGRGVEPRVMTRQIEAQIAWLKVIGRQVRPTVVVTQEQVDLAMRSAAAAGANDTEFLLAELLLPVQSPADEPQVMRDAQQLVRALRSGTPFGSLARQVSVAASAERGGELGWVRSSTIVEELRNVLLALRPGEVSDPIRSPDGIYIFQVQDRRGAGAAPAPAPVAAAPAAAPPQSAGSVVLAQLFFPLARNASAAQIEAATRRAAALRPRLGSCDEVEAVAHEIGAEQSGSLGRLRVADLPPVLAHTVVRLETGRISDPIRGPAGLHLLMVCDRDTPVQAAAPAPPPTPAPAAGADETREQVYQRLFEEQTQRLANRYLRELRRNAYIDFRS